MVQRMGSFKSRPDIDSTPPLPRGWLEHDVEPPGGAAKGARPLNPYAKGARPKRPVFKPFKAPPFRAPTWITPPHKRQGLRNKQENKVFLLKGSQARRHGVSNGYYVIVGWEGRWVDKTKRTPVYDDRGGVKGRIIGYYDRVVGRKWERGGENKQWSDPKLKRVPARPKGGTSNSAIDASLKWLWLYDRDEYWSAWRDLDSRFQSDVRRAKNDYNRQIAKAKADYQRQKARIMEQYHQNVEAYLVHEAKRITEEERYANQFDY